MSRRIPLILCATFLLAGTPATLRAGDPPIVPSPEERDRLLIGNRPEAKEEPRSLAATELLAGQDDFDVTNYFLDLNFDEVGRRVSGNVTITARSLVAGLGHVVLDLHTALTVSSAMRGSIVLPFSRSGSLIDVTLDAPVANGDSFAITVSYSGVPSAGTYIGWNKYSPGIQGQMVWSLSEPSGARYWWPCKDRPDDKATVQEWWTVNGGWTAAGNGVLQGVDTIGTRKRYRWAATHPLTTYLVSIAATTYATFSDSYATLAGGSMPLRYHVYTEDLADAQVAFSATPQMVGYFAQTFGEYPFVEDGYGMSAFPFSGAMEHSTNTSYGYPLITANHQYDYIIAHELSHQWWGDSVSPETWKDVWLNEGWASHSEALWAEHTGGAQAYRSYMNSLWRSSFSGTVYNPSSLFGTTVYNKGAWVQHMLRHVLGDSRFFGLLRGWHADHRDATGNTAQYQATAEGVYSAPLDWFFQQWVYAGGMPSYQTGFTSASLGGGVYRNYVRIRQVQVAGVFTMPADVALVSASGTETRTLWNDRADQDFILDTAQPLTSVVLDPENWILKSGSASIVLADADGDGVPDRNDDCPGVANSQQQDFDLDGSGDACDSDDDGDQLADAIDCAPLDPAQGAPGEVASLTLTGDGTGAASLSWTPASQADSYDVSRGPLGDPAAGSCLVTGWTALTLADPDVPPEGEGFEYLVRGVDAGCGGAGPAGTSSLGEPRSLPCP